MLMVQKSCMDMDVSKNSGTPQNPILMGFSIINHPFWGRPIFGNTHMVNIPLFTRFFIQAQVVSRSSSPLSIRFFKITSQVISRISCINSNYWGSGLRTMYFLFSLLRSDLEPQITQHGRKVQ